MEGFEMTPYAFIGPDGNEYVSVEEYYECISEEDEDSIIIE